MIHISFRGLTKRIDRWAYGYLIKTKDGRCWIQIDDEDNEVKYFPVRPLRGVLDNLVEVKRDTVGRFTGKLWKGQKVFEDDIFHIDLYGGYGLPGVVEYNEIYFQWMLRIPSDKPKIVQNLLPLKNLTDDYTFLGNIHENSEML